MDPSTSPIKQLPFQPPAQALPLGPTWLGFGLGFGFGLGLGLELGSGLGSGSGSSSGSSSGAGSDLERGLVAVRLEEQLVAAPQLEGELAAQGLETLARHPLHGGADHRRPRVALRSARLHLVR